jgi:hypothetical protein
VKRSEFVDVARAIQETWWAFPVPAPALDRLYRELADLDRAPVLAAVAALGERERPPTAAMVRAKVAELADDAPAWGEALAMMRRRLVDPHRADAWTCPDGACDGSGWTLDDEEVSRPCACRPAAIAYRRRAWRMDPLVGEFLDLVGWREARQAAGGDRTAEAQVREKYRAFLAERREDAVLALADPEGLPRVARARRRAPEALRGVLRRLLPGPSEP